MAMVAPRCARWSHAMPSLFQIVANTPLWVWPLMVFVLWLGVQGLRPRVIPWRGSPSCPWSASPPRWAASRNRCQPGLAGDRLGAGAARLPAAGLGLRPGPAGAAAPRGRPAGDRRRLVRAGRSAPRSSPCAMRWACCSASCRRCAASRSGSVLSGAVGGMVAGIGIGWLANLLRRARRVDGGCVMRLIALLVLALSTGAPRPPSPSSASTSRCARTCSPAWTATPPPSTAP